MPELLDDWRCPAAPPGHCYLVPAGWVCASEAFCRDVLAEERRRIWRYVQERAAATDEAGQPEAETWRLVAEEFPSPEQLQLFVGEGGAGHG